MQNKRVAGKGQGGRTATLRNGTEIGGYASAFTGTAGVYRYERANADDHKLIQRIEVHNPEKTHAHKSVKVDIYFTAMGLVILPDEQEVRKMTEYIRSISQPFKQCTA